MLLGACAVLTGARSFAAIAEYAHDTGRTILDRLGVGAVVPHASTIRRVLSDLDPAAVEAAMRSWVHGPTRPDTLAGRGAGLRAAPGPGGGRQDGARCPYPHQHQHRHSRRPTFAPCLIPRSILNAASTASSTFATRARQLGTAVTHAAPRRRV